MEACSPRGVGREARPARRPRLVKDDPHPTGARPGVVAIRPALPRPRWQAGPVGLSPRRRSPGASAERGSDGHLAFASMRQEACQGRGAGGWSTRPGRAPSGVVGADPEQVEAGLLADLVQDPTEVPRGEVLA